MAASASVGSRLRPGAMPALIGVAIDFLVGAGVVAIRTHGGSVGLRHVEGPLPTIAIAAAVIAPGVVALIGALFDRSVLYLAAAVGCLPMAVVSIAAVPVWIPGALFIVAFVRRAQIESPPPLRVAILVAGFPTFVFGPLLTMITHTSQYTYSFPGGSEGGDYFTPGRAAFAIVVIVADVVAATLIALPRSS